MIYLINVESTKYLPPIKSGFATSLFAELVVNPICTEKHIRELVQHLDNRSAQNYELDLSPYMSMYTHNKVASMISPSQLLQKSVMDNRLYKDLIQCHGMKVILKDVAYATETLPKYKGELIKLLIEKCEYELTDIEEYEQVIEVAELNENKQFVTVLKSGRKV